MPGLTIAKDLALQKLKDCCSGLRAAKCVGVCPRCKGDGCSPCKSTGRMPRYEMEQHA
jgi:hypothetical protein